MRNFLCCGNFNRCCRSECSCQRGCLLQRCCQGNINRIPIGTIPPPTPIPTPTPISTASAIMLANETTQTVASGGLLNLGGIITNSGQDIIYTSPNTITLSPGTYYISFSSVVTNTDGAGSAGITIQENGVAVPSTAKYVEGTAVGEVVGTQYLITATDTTQISVVNLSTVSNNYAQSNLIVTKLS